MDHGGKWRYLMGDNWETSLEVNVFSLWRELAAAPDCLLFHIRYIFLSNRKLFKHFLQHFFSGMACDWEGVAPVEPPPPTTSGICVLPAQRCVGRVAEESWLARVLGGDGGSRSALSAHWCICDADPPLENHRSIQNTQYGWPQWPLVPPPKKKLHTHISRHPLTRERGAEARI